MLKKISISCTALLLIITGFAVTAVAQTSDKVCGKWMSEKKNCVVQVYREGNDFKAKLLWFDNSTEPSVPMEEAVDKKNPNTALRNRKLIGMNVLENLEYISKTNSWENGMIYDAQSGKKWNSSAYMTDNNTLKVTGYWHFKFIGRTMTFKRVDDAQLARFVAKN